MPLAKYQADKIRDSFLRPNIKFNVSLNSVAWEVFCKEIDSFKIISRKDMVDRFISIAETIRITNL
jgi:hypothetical protein